MAQKQCILLLEDDIILANTLEKILSNKYSVHSFSCSRQAEKAFKENTHDLYIVDIILPNCREDGLDICKKIRVLDTYNPILIISAKNAINYKLGAFKLGINDYLCKPFNLLEFKARVGALLKENTGHIINFKGLVIDTNKRTVTRDSTEISLRKREFDIFIFLIENQNKILTRDIILNKLSNYPDICSNTVDVHIRNLRKKLEKPLELKIIKTVYGVGYTISSL